MSTVEQLIKNESHPEVLRELALFINQQNEILATELEQVKKEQTEKERRQQWLTNQIRAHLSKLRSRYFSKGRESLDKDRERRDDDKQLLMHAQSIAGQPSKKESGKLPKEENVWFTSPKELIKRAQKKDPELTSDNAKYEEIPGLYETATEITIVERTYTEILHKRQKYRVTNKDTAKETIVTCPGPVKLSPGCRYSVDFALHVVTEKFLKHVPYERQRWTMKGQGLGTSVMTMFRLSEQVALHHEKVCEKIRHDIFEVPLANHIDETPWPILSEHADDGRMWVLSNQAGSYYRFEPTRSGSIADELLKGYKGSVLTDKYSGYLHFRTDKNVNWGLCWSHARREFIDLKPVYPEEVFAVVDKIDDLFDIEREAKTWEQLKALRQKKSLKKLEEIKELLDTYRSEFFDRDDFCKAINYVLSAWKEFTAFVEDITLPLSNNDAERALRHSVLGRKNFNGSKTINGADVAAILYTVIETCKKAELDPVAYMKYVIEENQGDGDPLTPLNYAKTIRRNI